MCVLLPFQLWIMIHVLCIMHLFTSTDVFNLSVLFRFGRRRTTIWTMVLSGFSCGSVAFIPGNTEVLGTSIILYIIS